jgi:hypothetical protein
MTYPQQPYPPQPGYPPQGYAPQGYAPPAPGYGPPQGFAPQGYAPQGFAPQQPAMQGQAPPPVLARGTLEDFLNQAGGGAASVTKFFTDQRVNGHWLQLQISRDLLQSDVRQQTDNNDRPATDRAGNPKFVLVIPVNVLGSSDGSHSGIFTEGVASVWIKGVTKDGLLSAMSTAGVPKPDQALLNGKLGGASFVMISAGTRAPQKSGYSATKLYNFQYTPNGREMEEPTLQQVAQAASGLPTPPAPAPAAAMAPPTPPAPAQVPSGYQPYPGSPEIAQPMQYAPAAPTLPSTPPMPPTPGAPVPGAPQGYAPQAPPQQYADTAYQGMVPTPPQGYAPQAPPAPPMPPQGYAPQAPPAPPMGYAPPQDPEKAALLAKLQGQGG